MSELAHKLKPAIQTEPPVLIVEDDEGLAQLISEVVEGMGHPTLRVLDGEGALAILRRQAVELMLLDFSLPGISGLQLLNVIEQRDLPLPPFIVITGVGTAQLAVDMMKCGACDYLIKDTQLLANLPAVVTRALREAESARRLAAAEHALRESEAYNRMLFQGCSLPLVVMDPENGRFLDCNVAAIDVYRLEDRGAVLGKSWLEVSADIQHDNHPSRNVMATHIERARNEGSVHFEWRHQRSEGDVWDAEVILMTFRHNDQELMQVILQDVTERKQVEQTLRQAEKMDAVGQLTGGIAHDFNNLLGIIIGNLDLLEFSLAEDQESLDNVRSASSATLRAVDLTKQLLGFSRKRAGAPRSTDICQVIRSMESRIGHLLPPEVTVDIQLADDLWSVYVEPGDLESALMSLIINAQDAMPQGGKLSVTTANRRLEEGDAERNPTHPPGDYLQLKVTDDGCGMPSEIQSQIFEPFFTTKPAGSGTGLGLSMVYGFVQRSNGFLKVQSELGVGTTIEIYLPRGVEESDEFPQVHSGENRKTQGLGTILVVDDEIGLLGLAEDFLKSAGYRVFTAVRGSEALAILDTESDVDLLFSDVMMPGGMDGFELADQAQRKCPGLKVLLTSGFTKSAIAKGDQARLSADLLAKPYRSSEMLERIQNLMEGDEQSLGPPGHV